MQSGPERLVAEEWLPSRFDLATFRLLGLLVALASGRRPSAALLLHHEREQNALEAYALACGLLAVPSIHIFAAIVPRLRWPWLTGPLVALALPFATTVAWEAVVFSVALFTLALHRLTGVEIPALRLQNPAIHSLMIALSVCAVAYEWRTAWLGAAWLALVALNLLCSSVLWTARERVERFSREVLQQP